MIKKITHCRVLKLYNKNINIGSNIHTCVHTAIFAASMNLLESVEIPLQPLNHFVKRLHEAILSCCCCCLESMAYVCIIL